MYFRDMVLYEVRVTKVNRNYMPDPHSVGEMTFAGNSKDMEIVRVIAPKEYEHITPGQPLLRAFLAHKFSTWGPLEIHEIKELEFHGMLREFGT